MTNGVDSTIDIGQVIAAMRAGMRFMQDTAVYVGIPADKVSVEGEGVTNVELLYIHENGSPVMHIPPRPVVRMGLEDSGTRRQITDLVGAAAFDALNGNLAKAEQELGLAGQAGVNGVRSMFGSGSLAPNSPVTVGGGWVYNRVAKKSVHVEGKGSDKPLIDTGNLRQSITYVIRRG